MKTNLPTSRLALERAIAVLGGQTALASVVGKAQGHVSHWLKSGRVPADYCPDIELATREKGQVVTCEELRDDVKWSVLRKQPRRSKSSVVAEPKAA